MTLGATQQDMISALQWYIDHGVTDCVDGTPSNRFEMPQDVNLPKTVTAPIQKNTQKPANIFLGKSDAYDEAVKLAKNASSLDELAQVISEFDGIALKKTASNMVFCDGNPKADIMIVGEAPGADEDRLGKPFVGVSGQLLDRILKCIDLDRTEENPEKSVYISNILNWRPPGNRTPSPAEIEVSLPFIERHIQLAEPKILVFCGGVAAKSLLDSHLSISRLRRKWHDYVPQTKDIGSAAKAIPALATYHPSYLLRTPVQKKMVWEDVLNLQKRHISI